jgi:hypothetical protein
MNSISKEKAVMIVHGIGEQESFDTLFDFHEGIYSFLGKALKWHGDNLKKEYDQVKDNEAKRVEIQSNIPRELRIGTDEYLLPRSVGLAKEAYIDIIYRDEAIRIYEVWWAKDFTPPKLFAVFRWLFDSALIPFKKSLSSKILGVFTVLLYLIVALIYGLISVVYFFSSIVERLRILQPLFRWIKKSIEKGVVNFVGDVEIYINEAEESKKICIYLKGRIQTLLADEGISEINIIGHSLGSVITYEALCDLTESKPNNFSKIRNYITAGSPLDKIRYFFGAKRRFSREIDTNINWINYYAFADLVAARLDYFKRPVKNIGVANSIPLLHCRYWKNLFVMKDIISRIFTYDIYEKYPVSNNPFPGAFICWGYMLLIFIFGTASVALLLGLLIWLVLSLI